MHERLVRRAHPSLPTPGHMDAARGQRRLERWRAEAPFTAAEWWSQRVALEHASEAEWLTILGESSHVISQTVRDVPAWVTPLTQAFTCPPLVPAPLPLPDTWSTNQAGRFLEAFGPLIQQARSRVSTLFHGVLRKRGCSCDPATAEALLMRTCQPVAEMVLRTHGPRTQRGVCGPITGDTAEERFQSFINRITQPAHRHPTAEYQYGRLVVESLDRWVTVSVEWLQRLCEDWLAINRLCPARGPGALVQVRAAWAIHRGGSIGHCLFRSGFRVVYKPKSLALIVTSNSSWLAQRARQPPLRPMVLDRGQYGWVEHISATSCTSPEAGNASGAAGQLSCPVLRLGSH